MKFIEFPATLRVFVEDDTPADQIEKLAEDLVNDACGTIEETVLVEELKKYLEGSCGDSKLVIGSDLWVSECKGKLVVHSS